MGRIVPVYLDCAVVSAGICHPQTVGHFETQNTGYKAIFTFLKHLTSFFFSFFLHDSLLGRYHGFSYKKFMGLIWARATPSGREEGGEWA